MKKFAALIFLCSVAHADLSNLGGPIFDSSGNSLNSTSAALNSFITNSTLAVTQSGTWSTGRTWTLLNTTDSVNAVQSGTWTIKAQLQDNAGTAITLGQKTMASSVPVVLSSDQTGMNTFLDKSGTGSISALNGAVTVTTNGMSTIAFSAQGTFTATLQVQGQAGDNSWDTVIGYLPGSGATSTVLTGASMLVFPIGGFNQVRLIAIAYTSGTANIQYNLGNGVQGQQVFNLTPASLTGTMNLRDGSSNAITSTTVSGKQRLDIITSAEGLDGSSAPTNSIQIGGKDGSGNLQSVLTDTAGNLAILLKDSSANGITSSTVTGTAAAKQPLDTVQFGTATVRYYTTFSLQQSAASVINSTVFSMRNAAASTKTAYIESVDCDASFVATTPVTRTRFSYIFQRFSAATPTGGTALTAGQGDSSDAASQVTDIRFLDTGLTTTGVTFVANNLSAFYCNTSQGVECNGPVLKTGAIKLLPGEGLAVRLGVAAIVGQGVGCNINWREQ